MAISATGDWQLSSSELKKGTATVDSFCDNRSRYVANQPDLAWNLDSMVKLVYPSASAVKDFTIKDVTVDGIAGKQLSYSFKSNWFLITSVISGDNYQNTQASVPTSVLTPALKTELTAMFDSISVHVEAE